MFDIQAALALTQLSRMDDMQRRRFEAVKVYEEAFADVPELCLQKTPEYCHHSRHLYVMRVVPERLTISRDQFIEELKARNVGVSVHFIALHTMSAYRERSVISLRIIRTHTPSPRAKSACRCIPRWA